MQEQLNLLVKPAVLRALFQELLPDGEPVAVGSSTFSALFSDGLVDLCRFCLIVFRRSESLRTVILNTLAFSTNVVHNLWRLLKGTKELVEFVELGITGRYLYQFSHRFIDPLQIELTTLRTHYYYSPLHTHTC